MVRWTILHQAIRAHAEQAQRGCRHTISGGEEQSWGKRLTSVRARPDVAHDPRGNLQMLWRRPASPAERQVLRDIARPRLPIGSGPMPGLVARP